MRPQDIISDEEVDRVHANANFGPISHRSVIAQALLTTACGYHTGATARAIILDHGLVSTRRDPMGVPHLLKKGREYLWASYGQGV